MTMYVNSPNRIDHAASLAVAAERGFGLVTGCDSGRPVASLLPFCLEGRDDDAVSRMIAARMVALRPQLAFDEAMHT
jgi:hypothetical protein